MDILSNTIKKVNKDKLDFLLIQSPNWGIDNPPFGAMCIYNYIKKKGYNIKIIDLNLEVYQESNEKEKWDSNNIFLWYQKEYVKKIYNSSEKVISKVLNDIRENKPKIIGMSITGSNSIYSTLLVEKIRNEFPEQIIIAGGNGLYSNGDIANALNQKIDYDFLV